MTLVLLLCALAAVLLALGFEMFLVMGIPSLLTWQILDRKSVV